MKTTIRLLALCLALVASTTHANGRVTKPQQSQIESVAQGIKARPKASIRKKVAKSKAPVTKWVNWQTNPFLHLPDGGLKDGQLAIGIYGGAGAENNPAHLGLATRIGRAIAKKGHVTVTGAAPGFPDAAVKGALEEGGLVVGFSPHDTKARHLAAGSPANTHVMQKTPQHPFTRQLRRGAYAPEYTARELAMTHAADAGIFLQGRFGTLEELSMSLENKDVIGILTGLGGISSVVKEIVAASTASGKAPAVKVIYDSNPERLVTRVVKAAVAWKKVRQPGPLGEPIGEPRP